MVQCTIRIPNAVRINLTVVNFSALENRNLYWYFMFRGRNILRVDLGAMSFCHHNVFVFVHFVTIFVFL